MAYLVFLAVHLVYNVIIPCSVNSESELVGRVAGENRSECRVVRIGDIYCIYLEYLCFTKVFVGGHCRKYLWAFFKLFNINSSSKESRCTYLERELYVTHVASDQCGARSLETTRRLTNGILELLFHYFPNNKFFYMRTVKTTRL